MTRRRLRLKSSDSNDEATQASPAPEESLALESDSSAGSESDKEQETRLVAGPIRPQRCAILRAHFRENSDGDDGVVCDICHMTEHVNMQVKQCSGLIVTYAEYGYTTIVHLIRIL